MSPKTLTTVYLSDDLIRGLEILKERTGAAKGELIRRAVAEYLERQDVSGGTEVKTERKRAATRRRS